MRNLLQKRIGRLFGVAACVWAAAGTAGRAQTPGPAGDLGVLRTEISISQVLLDPQRPMWARFTLSNPSENVVEIPLDYPVESTNGLALPLQLIWGSVEQPALAIAYQNEKPVIIRPPSPVPPSPDAKMRVLRLAPHGALGTEVDLRELHRSVRYVGQYKLEWRPLGGQIAPALLQFRVETRKDAVLVTDYGKVTFALFYDKAPRNVDNFLDLARNGFYAGKILHRIVPGFAIQGGCPNGTGTGQRPDGKTVAAELNNTPFELGTLAMARKPDDPDSASCQFFISLGRLDDLDGKYTVIGQAGDEESLRTLQQLATLPTGRSGRPLRPVTIRSVTLIEANSGGKTVEFSATSAPAAPPAPAPPALRRPVAGEPAPKEHGSPPVEPTLEPLDETP